jgi:hypothetical protein
MLELHEHLGANRPSNFHAKTLAQAPAPFKAKLVAKSPEIGDVRGKD